MEQKPSPDTSRDRKPRPPRWNSPVWYLPIMLLILWLWQSTLIQFAYKTLPYSDFKEHLRRGNVVECTVKAESIEGRLRTDSSSVVFQANQDRTNSLAGSGAGSNAVASASRTNQSAQQQSPEGKHDVLFRTVRVEDPDLVSDLEHAGVKFTGERPSLLSQFMLSWILPLGIMFLLWSFLSRRIGRAGESILSFGKSRARLVPEKETKVTF